MRLIFFSLFISFILSFNVHAEGITDVSTKIDSLEKDLNNIQNKLGSISNSDGKTSQRQNMTALMQLEEIKENIKKLRGGIEQVQFDNARLNEKLVKMAADMEYRFHKLESASSVKQQKEENLVKDLDEELDNDVILQNSDERMAIRKNPSIEDFNDPIINQKMKEKSVEEKFKDAQTLLRQKQFEEAMSNFRDIINLNPGTDIAGKSHYWIGEIYFEMGDYNKAVVEYLKGYQSSIRGSRAADNLLKLGKAISKLDKREEACRTFQKLEAEFPNASHTIKRELEKEMKNSRC